MNHLKSKIVLNISLCIVAPLSLALPQIGAAPKGEAKTIASKIIKYNFPLGSVDVSHRQP
ncbi:MULTISPECIES: hypothetical protein [unclassified Undibacterium]|uniref:hypothetical protein n=1 Tax=unclassified Undibacterium TaxID=2630295 RepID=UPI003C2B3AB9